MNESFHRACFLAIIGWCVMAAPMDAEHAEGEYRITYAETKPVGNGKYTFQLKEKKVGLQQLLNELKRPERQSRLNAIRAIAWPDKWPKKDSAILIKALGGCLKDKDVAVRYHAVDALSRVGPECIAVLSALIDTVKDKEVLIRSQALCAIGKIGPKAKPAIAALINALADEQELLAGHAATALGNVGVDAVPALIKALKSSKAQVRAEAAYALGMIGPEAKEALTALKKLFADGDKYVAYRARFAVDDIEENPERPIHFYPGKLHKDREKNK